MTAHSFIVQDLVTGRRLGGAVVCPLARYASVITNAGIERRFVAASEWPKIEKQEYDSGPLDADSPVSRALLGERRTHSLTLQRLHELPISDEQPETVTPQLDQLLRSLMPPTLSLRQEKGDN